MLTHHLEILTNCIINYKDLSHSLMQLLSSIFRQALFDPFVFIIDLLEVLSHIFLSSKTSN
jgi:hypothetical protein